MNTYTLSYDIFNARIDAGQVAGFIRDNRHIEQWYNPFAGSWLLKSNDPLYTLSQSFTAFFSGTAFVIALVYPINMGGALPQEVWNWVNTGVIAQQPSLLS